MLGKIQPQHSVGFQPKGSLYILPGNYRIIICNVITRPCIVFTSGLLQRRIEIGDMKRPAKHKMLKKMRKTRTIRRLVPSPHIIQQIYSDHSRIAICMMQQSQSIEKLIFIYLQSKTFMLIFISCSGRSPLRVGTDCIRSKTSKPSTTSPKTV